MLFRCYERCNNLNVSGFEIPVVTKNYSNRHVLEFNSKLRLIMYRLRRTLRRTYCTAANNKKKDGQ